MTRAETGTKVCRNCKRELPISDFYVSAGAKDGHRNVCKHCYIERKMQQRKDNPNYNTKHHTKVHPIEKPKARKPRVGNGQGDRHGYFAKMYAERKDEIKAKQVLGAIEAEKQKPKPVPARLCDTCERCPCLRGWENLQAVGYIKYGRCNDYKPKISTYNDEPTDTN